MAGMVKNLGGPNGLLSSLAGGRVPGVGRGGPMPPGGMPNPMEMMSKMMGGGAGGMPDMSALANMMGGQGGFNPMEMMSKLMGGNGGGMPDMSALLGGMGRGMPQQPPPRQAKRK